MEQRLAVVGLYGMSALFRLDSLPQPGQTVRSRGLIFEQGGKGYNQAIGALRAGARVFYAAAVGDDAYGKDAPDVFRQDGLTDFACLTVAGQPTAFAAVVSDAQGENEVIVEQGANACWTSEMADSLEEEIAKCSAILLQCEMPDEPLLRFLTIARRHGLYTVLNPAPARLLPDALLSLCDLVTPNWGEAQTITGLPGAPVEDVAQALLRSGCGAGVITLGSRGVYAQKAGQPGFYRPAFSVSAVDTTGAGDNFNGALCARLLAGDEFMVAVRYACASSALSVTRRGVIAAIPTREEVKEFLRHECQTV